MKNFMKDVVYLLNGALILLVILVAAEMALERAQRNTLLSFENNSKARGDFYAVGFK